MVVLIWLRGLVVAMVLLGLPAGAGGSDRPAVVVDPGHGGPHPGAVGVASRRPEAQNVLAIGLYLRDLLEEAGYRVVLTRSGDYLPTAPGHPDQLDARVAIAREAAADIFVSLHNNAYPRDPSVRGNMVFHRTACPDSRELARTLAEALRQVTGQPDRGVHPAGFRVLRLNPLPAAVLVEIGFLTSAADDWLLGTDAYRRQVAVALHRGIERYLGGIPAVSEPPEADSTAIARAILKTPPEPRKIPEPRRLEIGGRILVNARDLARLDREMILSLEGKLLLVPDGGPIPAVMVDGEVYVLAALLEQRLPLP
ncbi:MAG: N-acetylmuramoyl-L-alanine amidase [bacterium]|nr:N-acetylmuramoyl-L-alanine amidase [bacterium]